MKMESPCSAVGRSLRKRKTTPLKTHESDSNNEIDDDEFILEADNINVDDENLSDESGVKKKSLRKKNPVVKTEDNTESFTTPEKSKSENKRQKRAPDSIQEKKEGGMDLPIPTLNGGYSHTKKSRAKIGLANKGNTPWNKGRIRSEEDKAKISAGVKARNRQVLLAKLEKLGMTEDDWWKQKKKIKLTREVGRRKRVKEKERLKKEAILNARTDEEIEEERFKKDEAERLKQEEKERVKRERKERAFQERQEAARLKAAKDYKEIERVNASEQKRERAKGGLGKKVKIPLKPKPTKKEISWKVHPFDERSGSYAKCPSGGPGGLICPNCAACSSSYTQYMDFTVRDFEQQAIDLVAHDFVDVVENLKKMDRKLYDALSM